MYSKHLHSKSQQQAKKQSTDIFKASASTQKHIHIHKIKN